jgi:hypothetical protein
MSTEPFDSDTQEDGWECILGGFGAQGLNETWRLRLTPDLWVYLVTTDDWRFGQGSKTWVAMGPFTPGLTMHDMPEEPTVMFGPMSLREAQRGACAQVASWAVEVLKAAQERVTGARYVRP